MSEYDKQVKKGFQGEKMNRVHSVIRQIGISCVEQI